MIFGYSFQERLYYHLMANIFLNFLNSKFTCEKTVDSNKYKQPIVSDKMNYPLSSSA